MPHDHAGPSPPPVWGANTNVTRYIWDGISTCQELTFFANETDIPDRDCCQGGLFIAADLPYNAGVAVAWFIILCWIFVPGVAMGADVFMTSIEVITSKEAKVVRKVGNTFQEHHVRVWNSTVANLTLMALGSSAPEILLSIIEILTNDFYAGSLGPSTIVGSAAFNLMVITAVCIVAIPAGETRTIKQLGVFLTTSIYSVFAYIWLLIIVVVWTPDVVTVTEGLLTVIFLFLLIAQAFFFDVKSEAISKVLSQITPTKTTTVESPPAKSASNASKGVTGAWGPAAARAYADEAGSTTTNSSAQGSADTLSKLPKKGGLADAARAAQLASKAQGRLMTKPEDIAEAIADQVDVPIKSRAHYRRESVQWLSGGANVIRPSHTKYSEGQRVRTGALPSMHSMTPSDRTTTGGDGPVGVHKVSITMGGSEQITVGSGKLYSTELGGSLGTPVTKLSGAGTLRWQKECDAVSESVGTVECVVERIGDAKGVVSVRYKTKDQSATGGKDYEMVSGELVWADGDNNPKTIPIKIVDDEEYEKDEEFTIVLFEPTGGASFPHTTDGGEEEEIMTITIVNNDERAAALRKALMLLNVDYDSLDLATSDWGAQIFSVFELEDRSMCGRFQAALAFPWKLMFCLVPPPGLCGGWPCFVGSLAGIAIQVVLISDFASQMGCQMHLKDSVTAITFVALGTSLPDTFASVQAARGDKTADNSIGNVTGSNSVNVFFGLGLPWLVAAAKWQGGGQTDEWRRRYADIQVSPGVSIIEAYPDGAFVVRKEGLGFSVTIFTICAVTTITLILMRRFCSSPAAELGGSKPIAYASACVLVLLWIMYVVLSSIKSYEKELGLGTFGF